MTPCFTTFPLFKLLPLMAMWNPATQVSWWLWVLLNFGRDCVPNSPKYHPYAYLKHFKILICLMLFVGVLWCIFTWFYKFFSIQRKLLLFLNTWIFFCPFSYKFSLNEWIWIKLNSIPNIFLLVSLEHFLADPDCPKPVLIFYILFFFFFFSQSVTKHFLLFIHPLWVFLLSHEPNISVLSLIVLTNAGLFWLADVSVWIYQESTVSSLLSPRLLLVVELFNY